MARVDVYFEPGDDVPAALRTLLEIAQDPARVTWVAGTNHVVTDDEVASEYQRRREAEAAEAEKAEKKTTTRRARKSTAEKGNADG